MPPSTDILPRLSCRLCNSPELISVFKLPDTPLANEFLAAKDSGQATFPLEVVFCIACGHSQLRHVVSPKRLFENYVYVSGTSPSFVQHFKEYAEEIQLLATESLTAESRTVRTVLEIGSNDGTLLKELQKLRWKSLGIEPAKAIAEKALVDGIDTINAFFDEYLVPEIRRRLGVQYPNVIVANNVLAHVDDLEGVVNGAKALLGPHSTFVFEVQWLGALLKSGNFDMVYHEHLDYHTVNSLFPFLTAHGLELFRVDPVPTHGGSIRCWTRLLQPDPKMRKEVPDGVLASISEERSRGAVDGQGWRMLNDRLFVLKRELRELLSTLKTRNVNVIGYGAPAKLTTFCYGLGLIADDFDYIVDDSPLKQGLYTPGLNVPVLPPSVLYDGTRGYPDYVLVTAWNFARDILEKHKALRESGTHFIIPFPYLVVTE